MFLWPDTIGVSKFTMDQSLGNCKQDWYPSAQKKAQGPYSAEN